MTLNEAVDRIRVYIGRRSDVTPAEIGVMVNERLKMIAVSFELPEHELMFNLATVIETPSIDVSNISVLNQNGQYYVYAITRVIDMTNNRELVSMDQSDYVNRSTTYEVYQYPRYFSLHAKALYFYPTPDGAYDLTVYGKGLPVDIIGEAQLPFPLDWHPLICKYVASDILFMKGTHERALALKNEALGDLSTRQEPRTIMRRTQTGQINVQRAGYGRRSRNSDYNGW